MLEGPIDGDNQQKFNGEGSDRASQKSIYDWNSRGNSEFSPEWIAGLVDAEGYFSIHFRKKKKQWAFSFGIRMNVREKPLLERLQKYFGAGHIRLDKSDNTARLVIEAKDDLKRIAHFFTHSTRLRSKKAREFMVWKRALFINDKQRISQLNDLRKTLRPRPFKSRVKATDSWVLGFIEGDGGFLVAVRPKQLVRGLPYIYCYFNMTQKEREVLDKIQIYLGLGKVNLKSKRNPKRGFTYDIGADSELQVLIGLLDKLSFHSAPKYHDYTIWKIIVGLVRKGYHLNLATHQLIIRLARSMHKYDKL